MQESDAIRFTFLERQGMWWLVFYLNSIILLHSLFSNFLMYFNRERKVLDESEKRGKIKNLFTVCVNNDFTDYITILAICIISHILLLIIKNYS